MNLLVYVTQNQKHNIYRELLNKLQGFKKNDISIVINLNGSNIEWVEVSALTDKKLFLSELRSNLKILENLTL